MFVMKVDMGKWWNWLNANVADSNSPIQFRRSTAGLTGQDSRALEAIAACWALYAVADETACACALASICVLLPAVQIEYRPFARELIAFAMDWEDRDRLWARVTAGRFDAGRVQ
jgi:hypothetical protein